MSIAWSVEDLPTKRAYERREFDELMNAKLSRVKALRTMLADTRRAIRDAQNRADRTREVHAAIGASVLDAWAVVEAERAEARRTISVIVEQHLALSSHADPDDESDAPAEPERRLAT